jgi:hypothetical protein
MADYYIQTVINPSIPTALFAPLELFLLQQVCEWEVDEPSPHDTLYFFASECPSTSIVIDESMVAGGADGFRTIIEVSRPLCPFLCDHVVAAWDGGGDLDLDDVGMNFADILQSVVKRAGDQLRYITIEESFTCSKMRPDGFGGAATLITPSEIISTSTQQWLQDQLAARGFLPTPQPQQTGESTFNPSFAGQDDRACREGWGLFHSDERGLEVQADSESPIFVRGGVAYDDEAHAFVEAQAAAGSKYHRAALDRIESKW